MARKLGRELRETCLGPVAWGHIHLSRSRSMSSQTEAPGHPGGLVRGQTSRGLRSDVQGTGLRSGVQGGWSEVRSAGGLV